MQIKITEKKKEKMVEHAEKALKHLGKLMQCVEELGENEEMGERYGNRYTTREGGGSMGNRGGINYRSTDEDDFDDEDDEMMHQRRRRSSVTGRYM